MKFKKCKIELRKIYFLFIALLLIFLFLGIFITADSSGESFEETFEGNSELNLIQHNAVLGEPVKWTKTFSIYDQSGGIVTIPQEAKEVSLNKINELSSGEFVKDFIEIKEERSLVSGAKEFFAKFYKNLGKLTGFSISSFEEAPYQKEIGIEEEGNYEIAYETSAPSSIEENTPNGKRIKISSPENIRYENVLSFTEISEELNLKNKNQIKIYWIENNTYITPTSVEDTDNNGIYDYVEWITPHLSEQTFEIIVITYAEHLDSNREFISNIFEEVNDLDGVWSETINEGEYVRVTFEVPLTSNRDITIFPRVISGTPRVEVYEFEENELVAEFSFINSNEFNKVYLNNLQGSQDTFDLRVVGGSVEFDYIVDPAEILYATSHITGSVSTSNNALGAIDGSWTTDTGNTNWDSRFAMGNPSGALTGTQTVRVLVRKDSSGGNNPTVDAIDLYENGVFVANLVGSTSVSSATGVNLSGTFSAVSITNPNNVEILVSTSGVGGPPSSRRAVQVNSIIWEANVAVADTTAPQYSSLTENPSDDVDYSYGTTYEFNSTWTDDVALSIVRMSFDGVNTTISEFGSGVYRFTRSGLSAGSYNYFWWANDTSGNVNSTGTLSYTINQATPAGSISGTSSINYGTAGDVEGTESNNGDSDVTYLLYRNGTQVSNPDTTVLSAGFYSYVYNTTGGTNYSSSASLDTFELTVNPDTTPPFVSILYPANTTYNLEVSELNFSASDGTSLGNCWYSIDNGATNSTPNDCSSNFTGLLSVEGENTWIVYANDTSGNENSSSVTFTFENLEITVNATITDTSGNPLNTTVTISYASNETIFYDETNVSHQELIINGSELYDLIINPHDLDFIEEIAFEEINLTSFEGESINLIEVEEIEDHSDFEIIHVINPTIQDFFDATMTIIPGAKRLYECLDWNITSNLCNGNWTQLNNSLIAETEYNITLSSATSAYGEIPISNALHLNSNREFLSNIFEQVRYFDDNWSETIPSEDYVRVTFLENLSSSNDITIYPRTISGDPFIEIYERNESTLIANFTSIDDNLYNTVLLSGLVGTQNIFDLHIVGGSVEFDHIVDPSSVVLIDADALATATGVATALENVGKNLVKLNNNNLIAFWTDAASDPSCELSTNEGLSWGGIQSESGTDVGVAVATNGTGVIYITTNAGNGAGDIAYIHGTAGQCDTAGTYADVGSMLANQRPDIAYDGVHNTYVVCSLETADGGLDVAYTSTTSISWTTVNDINGAQVGSSCSIDVNDNGNVFISQNSGANGIIVYNSSAGTFASTSTVTAYSSAVDNMHMSIRGNEILITAIDGATDDLVLIWSTDGLTYTNTTYAGTFQDPEGCIDENGNYHIAMVNGSVLDYIRYNGNTFDNAEIITNTGTERYPSVRCTNFPSNNRLGSSELELVYTDTGTNIYFVNLTINTSAVFVDTTPPEVTINFPQNTTYYRVLDMPFTFNVSLNENGSVIYSLNGGANNITMNTTNNQSFDAYLEDLEVGQYTFKVFSNDSGGNRNDTESVVFTLVQENIIVNGTVTDSSGNLLNATVTIIEETNQSVVYNETDIVHEGIVPLNTTYTVDISPLEVPSVDVIQFTGLNFSLINDTITSLVQIEENDSLSGVGNFSTVFSINPQIQNFSDAAVSFTAQSNSLFKCVDWNFTAQSCGGNWSLLMKNLVIGQSYSFLLNPGDPGYGVINISEASHLDENRSFISNITEEVKDLDGIWSETIPNTHYVRVVFEEVLGYKNDITIYPIVVSGNPIVRVFPNGGTQILAEFSPLNNNTYNTIFLTNLTYGEDTFDLRVMGGDIQFDHIVDPTTFSLNYNFSDTTNNKAYNSTSNTNLSATLLSGGTELPSTGYTGIQTNNNVNATATPAGTNDYVMFRYVFNLNQSASVISLINVTWVGAETADDTNMELFIQNWTGNSRTRIGTIPAAKGTLTFNFTGERISQHMGSSNNVTLVAWNPSGIADSGGAEQLITDFVKLDVTYVNDNPKWSSNSTNGTSPGEFIQHSLNWTDDFGLSGYIFSFDNGTGTFVNDSFRTFTGTQNWSNVTKFVNQTSGSTIRWRVFANDSVNNLNSTSIFSYNVVSNPAINLFRVYPTGNINVTQNEFFNITVNVTCVNADCGDINVSFDPASWYSSSWLYRNNITIDSNKVSENLTDFPVFLNLSDFPSVFHGNITNIGEIRITTDDGVTEVPREIALYHPSTDTGEVWIKANISNVVNKTFYIYYGNPSASDYLVTDTYGRNNVWNSNYVAVYHMHADPTGAAPQYNNSKGAAHNGTATNLASDDNIISQIGNGTDFLDTSSQRIEIPDSSQLDFVTTQTNFTISVWTKNGGGAATNQRVLQRTETATPGDAWAFLYNGASNNDEHAFNVNAGGTQYTVFDNLTVADNTWHYLVGRVAWSGGTPTLTYYKDAGLQLGTTVDSYGTGDDNEFWIGGRRAAGNFYTGTIDEVRVMNIVLPSTWISTEYNNQNNASSFYLVGAQEENEGKGGLIPVGSGNPFYTNESNPRTINLNESDSILVTAWINATGNADSTYIFFEYANMTSDMSVSNITSSYNVTIVGPSDEISPLWSSNSTNSTLAGEFVRHSVLWTDNTALSGYIFSFDNGTGTFVNDSFVTMSGATDWSNVTKYVNETVGSTIQWIVYANDTSNNWNNTNTFQYLTTALPAINLFRVYPSGNINVTQNEFFNVTVNVTCVNADCGDINVSFDPLTSPIVGITFNLSTINDTQAPGSDNWPLTWSDDDHQYTSWGDGGGFGGDDTTGRVGMGIARIEGNKTNYTGINVNGGLNPESGNTEWPDVPEQHGKSKGIISLGGVLYLWRSGNQSDNSGYYLNDIWKSTDKGDTWAQVPGLNWTFSGDFNNQFPTFHSGHFLNYGKDNANATDNYVYVYAPETVNSSWEVSIPGNISLLRVLESEIENKSNWEYFAGLDGSNNPTWTSNISNRKPVWQDATNGVMRISVNYVISLNRYVLIAQQVSRFRDSNGHIGIYESPTRYGPWTQIYFRNPWAEGLMDNSTDTKTVYYGLSQKWASSDGLNFVMVGSVHTQDGWGFIEGTFNISGKGGLIPFGSGEPFYTNQSNPRTISLNQGESVLVTAWINATGEVNTVYEFLEYANRTADMTVSNQTSSYNVTIVEAVTDTTAPKWSQNSTNSTSVGEFILHSVNWTDETALSGYIFSFDNGTGTFVNDSFVIFSGTQNYSNVTKYVNETVGSTIQWYVWANDSSGNVNSTDLFSYETQDITSPTFSNVAHNNSHIGDPTLFSVLWDNDALHPNGQYIFSTNNTGTWVNDSAVNFTTTPSWANVTKTLNSTSGVVVGYQWFATDNAGNFNSTDVYILTTYTRNITTCIELQLMNENRSDDFILGNNIDCSDTVNWNSGEGFVPVGNGTSFTGTFDGQNFNISDLFIDRNEGNQGLFGRVNNSEIENVGLLNVNISSGIVQVGGLMGQFITGTINNSYSTGNVNGRYVGGLVGNMVGGTILNSYSTASLSGEDRMGGLVGQFDSGVINNSYSTGSVNGIGGNGIGGLVGQNAGGTISNSYSTGNVFGAGSSQLVGGLVGFNRGAISNSYSTGNVSGNTSVGGLAGVSQFTSITNSYSTGNVSGNTSVGGLMGSATKGSVLNSYSTGNVNGVDKVGGLIGEIVFTETIFTVNNTYSIGNVSGNTSVGGLIGEEDGGSINNSFWDMNTSSQTTSAGGTGKNTTEMKNIFTFNDTATAGLDQSWNITDVNFNETDETSTWNIIDTHTYPFLSWEDARQASDTCVYVFGNWEIDLGDFCVISINTNLGSNNITFIGTGNITFNATITACDVGVLPASQRGYIGSNARVNFGGSC